MKFYFAGADGGSKRSLVHKGVRKALWSFGRPGLASELKAWEKLLEEHNKGLDTRVRVAKKERQLPTIHREEKLL